MKPILSALGLINALGSSKEEVLNHFLSGCAPGMQAQNNFWTGRVTATLPAVPKALTMFDCRNNRLLLAALAQIQTEIDTAITQYGAQRIAVVIGSSTSGIAEGEAALAEKLCNGTWSLDFDYRQQEIGTAAEFVARFLDLTGVAMTVSTACSSSAKALGSARRLLELDLCDAVICGGSDSLCQLTLQGFSALESVSHTRCEPFAAGRDGITIGEGSALFLMQKKSDNANAIVFSGIGESADAHHISAPHPDGIGAEAAMRAALADANMQPAEIAYINLHGTATPLNDAMESAAIQRIFGNNTPCSSTKPLTGHTLGAAGATEVALCWLLLSDFNEKRILPAQCNQKPPDTALAAIAILRDTQKLLDQKNTAMLSNSFAFGGSNAAVILSRLV
ncbi:MAG TPA: beta-ketoacyl-[acyl-carrier-protein] synthase family protein [Pseudomonadales bacterium]|nr:beta-ketoacyl-[acyl-carrier-protein] synthase family protein [Pseudomonadales bacterium]HNL91900.1 beta-ketoacyl-[acyl-carrier-protein] synthase family protein [Pseudomonadales bacterium]